MNPESAGLSLLSSMITPAVLISACGTLIFSTSTRLARVVDRARQISAEAEALGTAAPGDASGERVVQMEGQLAFYARRSRLVQGALTSFYVSLGLFVASTVSIGASAFVPDLTWVPGTLGVIGTLVLFAGCVLLISETRLAVVSLEEEMDATMRLFERRHGRAAHRRPAEMASQRAEASLRAGLRRRPIGREMAGARYAFAAATAVSGLLIWVVVAVLNQVAEAWDSPSFYRVGVPLLALISGLAGFLRPRGATWWGLTTVALIPMALLVTHAEREPLSGVDLILMGTIAATLTIVSLLGAGARWAMPPRRGRRTDTDQEV